MAIKGAHLALIAVLSSFTCAVFFTPSTTDDVKWSETTWPVKVEEGGSRSSSTFRNQSEEEEDDDEVMWDHVTYLIQRQAPEPDLKLDLKLEKGIKMPKFVVENARENIRNNKSWFKMNGNDDVTRTNNDVIKCVYYGSVVGDQSSKVVVSLCGGMMGQIHTSGGEYSISPKRDSNYHKSSSFIPHELKKLKLNQYYGSDVTDQSTRQNNHFRHSGHGRVKVEKFSENGGQHRIRHGHPSSGFSRGSRGRRSVSVEQHLEIMVVVDNLMAKYYKQDLQLYILTLMSIVRLIYHDPSIGNLVNIAVVKLLVMDKYEDEEILKSANVSTILKKFCRWQQSHNIADDSHPFHHDTAILITRKDICLETPPVYKCEILGLAEVGKMCDPRKSCSVVEDTGLSTAFTIAHELGHVLNMPHDNDKSCIKFIDEDKDSMTLSYIMAAAMGDQTDPWRWSTCSRHFLTEFLDSDDSSCVLDKPTDVLEKEQPKNYHLQYQPGELYDAIKQCELLYSTGYKPCYNISQSPCQMLWCEGPNHDGCLSKHSPWADGTECGFNRWCQRGKCVRKNYHALITVHGSWSEWSSYSECSRTCGGGIAKSRRLCNNPEPKNGGRYCLGRRARYKSCNPKDCEDQLKSFRDSQCEVFNGVDFDLKDIPAHPVWVPKFYTEVQEKDACRLICSVNGTSMYHVLKDKVTDGTPCRPDSFDICVNGNCLKAGCDHILGSNTKVDMCNVCEGNNSTCRIVSGTFNVSRYGYNLVKLIPTGAANILIEQKGYKGLLKDDNYLALKSNDGYILNGKFVLRSFELKLYFESVEIEYSGSNTTVEKISIKNSLRKDLMLEILTVGHLYPPDIRYRYTVPIENDDQYKWHLENQWSECTKVCKGEQYRRVVCVRNYDRVLVSDDHCKHQKKPDGLAQVCNLHCSLRWHITAETECSSRCSVGTKKRSIQCFQVIGDNGSRYPLHDRYCTEVEEKPPEKIKCQGDCADVFWKLGEWSECSKTCGGGVQSREAQCMDSNGKLLSNSECQTLSKTTVQSCNTRYCPKWNVNEWSPCSVTCGDGIRHRTRWCQEENNVVNDAYCDSSSAPSREEKCAMRECASWDYGEWGPCSTTCGEGFTKRKVRCVGQLGQAVSIFLCNRDHRPKDTMECDLPACATHMTSTETSTFYTHFNSSIYLPSSIEIIPVSKATRPPIFSQIKRNSVAQRINPIWKTGSWTECSRVCGEGIKERYVACHDSVTEKRLPDTACNASLKPSGRQVCRDRPCGYWRTGEWSSCSKSCGGGFKQRQVRCLDQRQTEISLCEPENRPTATIRCNTDPCPDWVSSEWSECSVTCGEGHNLREVECKSDRGQLLPPKYCDVAKKSISTRSCSTPPCSVQQYYWIKGDWSKCSVTCGKGIRMRSLKCAVRGTDAHVSDTLCSEKQPRSKKRCRRNRCPKWQLSRWSKCSSSCNGTQERVYQCRHRRRIFDMSLCTSTSPRPEKELRMCNIKPKCVYKWKSKSWSKCTKACGTGITQRRVYCADEGGKSSPDRFCKRRKPRNKRRCNTHDCDFTWKTSYWSACTHTCDIGIQTRDVTCHRVNLYGWIAPRPISYPSCDQSTRPQSVRRCNYGSCHFRNSNSNQIVGIWKVGSWKACSTVCGQGMKRRKVRCHSHNGKKLPKKYCDVRLRPRKKQVCWHRPCTMINCKDVKQRLYTRKDGEYTLFVHGNNVRIYCARMNSSSPVEYITLSSPQTENYSEIYSKRLLQPHTCPSNGKRDDNCHCRNDFKHQAGFTAYSKIRINVTTLQVITNDFTFSNSIGNRKIRYAEAGDCYSEAKCPQGRFSINLINTDFIIWKDVGWRSHGNKASVKIHRTADGVRIKGQCGGYCGNCYPDHGKGGLILDVAGP